MLLFWGVGVALASTSLANEEDDQAWRLEDLEQAQSTMPIALLRDERKEDRRLVVLLADWLYCYPPDRELYRVPRGYISDFASIPKAAQGLINPFGDQAEAAVIHDWLYAVGEEGKRPHADEIFRYALMEQASP